MEINQKIKNAIARNVKAMTLRPNIARGTAVTTARVIDGMTCEIAEGQWQFTADMHEKHGGDNAGPNPGVLGRGALASCLAICYAMWAARLNVPMRIHKVEVQADYDTRGEYAVAPVPVTYSEVRFTVTLESPAAEEDILCVLNTAEAYSSYFIIFSKAMPLRREVKILETEDN